MKCVFIAHDYHELDRHVAGAPRLKSAALVKTTIGLQYCVHAEREAVKILSKSSCSGGAQTQYNIQKPGGNHWNAVIIVIFI